MMVEELLNRMRLLEVDHEPDGWPAVRMRDITALVDEIERRVGIGGELIVARRERDAAQIENAKLRRVLKAAVENELLGCIGGNMIGGVLTYEIKSGGRACGQMIGADGSGEFAVVINGAADVAEQWAKDHLRKIEASGARLGRIVFVAAADCYMGQAITVVQPNA